MPDRPLALFISFTTYGAWLHGKAPGSVDRDHNEFASPFLSPDAAEERAVVRRMPVLRGVDAGEGQREELIDRRHDLDPARHRQLGGAM